MCCADREKRETGVRTTEEDDDEKGVSREGPGGEMVDGTVNCAEKESRNCQQQRRDSQDDHRPGLFGCLPVVLGACCSAGHDGRCEGWRAARAGTGGPGGA